MYCENKFDNQFYKTTMTCCVSAHFVNNNFIIGYSGNVLVEMFISDGNNASSSEVSLLRVRFSKYFKS